MTPSISVSDLIDNPSRVKHALSANGFVVVRGVVDSATMSAVASWWNTVRRPLRNGETIDGLSRYNNFYIHGALPEPVGSLYKNESIISFMQYLYGSNIALYMNRINVKDIGFDTIIPLHQDIPYFHGEANKLNAFLALTDMNYTNGGVVYAKGSHSLGAMSNESISIEDYPDLELCMLTMRPGDLLLADIRTWHASVANAVKKDRVLLQMIYQPASDGSYYQDSLNGPTLVSGSWETDDFTPWVPQ